jgi:heptosyltransferase-2
MPSADDDLPLDSAPRRILIIQTGFLGDVVLTTPVIRATRRMFPCADITFLTTPATADLVRYHPEVSRVIEYDKRGKDKGHAGLRALASELSALRFDIAFVIHKSSDGDPASPCANTAPNRF